jgi:hypothetical protein
MISFEEKELAEELIFDYDELVGENDAAYLLRIGEKKVWLPNSCCLIDRQAKTVFVPEALAINKGLV